MPGPINMVDPTGRVFSVPEEKIAAAITEGFRPESDAAHSARLGSEILEEGYDGVGGDVAAFGAGALSGLTFGGSDALLTAVGGEDAQTDLRRLRDVNPGAATAGQIAGALVPIVPGASASALIRATPAGIAARAGARIAAEGAEAGVLGRAAYTAAGGALEGAAQNTGAYLSQVALGDKELSADGFVGAMGKGALYGGVAGGALSLAGSGVTAARRLLPKEELTEAAVRKAEQETAIEVSAAIDDSREIERAARARLRQLREERAATDLATKQELDAIAIAKARELAEAQTTTAKAKADAALARAERAKAGPAKRKRKAFGGDDEPAPPAAGDEAVPPAPESASEPTPAKAPAPKPAAGPTSAPAPSLADEVADAVTAPVAASADDDLLKALQTTKAGLDEGSPLAKLSAAKRETYVEDALNAHVAQSNEEARRLLGHVAELGETRDAMAAWIDKYKGGKVRAFDYAEGMRKQSGYASVVPEGEGSSALPRGRTYEFRGDEAARAAADARITAKVTAEDIVAGDEAAAALSAKWNPKATAQQIVNATDQELIEKGAHNLDEQIGSALRSRVDDVDDDLDAVIGTITRFEQKMADAADELGVNAPPRAAARAKGYREAQGAQAASTEQQTIAAVGDLDKAAATIGLGGPPAPAARAGLRGLIDKASQAGEALEMLKMMGVPVPDPANIPVIGPLLSAVLKGKLGWRAIKRMQGLPATAETTIAGKSAALQQRVYTAIDKALDVGGKALSRASRSAAVPTTAAILGHTLFDDGEPTRKPYSSAPKGSDLQALYDARADELARAMAPGAIRDAIRQRIQTSDPQILDAIVAAEERKLQLLSDKLPRPSSPSGILDKRPYVPSKIALGTFSRYVQAADDPAAVIEAAAAGVPVSREAAETLRTVYPRLMEVATRRLIERSADLEEPLPFKRRMALSSLFDLPLDASLSPEYAAFLQEGYSAPPPAPQPMPMTGQPTIAADVALGARVDPMTEGALA